MATLYDLLPDASAVLALEPEELGGFVLELLLSEKYGEAGRCHPANFIATEVVGQFPSDKVDAIRYAMAEAWNWLVREGMLAGKPGDSHGWHFVTRRGRRIANRIGVEAYRRATVLPRSLLHPVIVEVSWTAYFRGEYDTAVFKAFRELEIAIRAAGNYDQSLIGTDLARKAFNESSGPLTDQTVPPGERNALQNLMAGAIGSYKNPHSHRKVEVGAEEAGEMLILASHLLKIVDSRGT